jgi:hypothetical protein
MSHARRASSVLGLRLATGLLPMLALAASPSGPIGTDKIDVEWAEALLASVWDISILLWSNVGYFRSAVG